MRDDIAEAVTAKLLTLMETSGSNWAQPWIGGGLHRNAVSKKPYRGVNTMLTGMAGYGSPFWATYKQWTELGAQVRKGEKSTLIIFWKSLNIRDKETDETTTVPMAKFYPIFNKEQVDGGPDLVIEKRPEIERHAECDRIIAASGADITHGGDRAFYSPSVDRVTLPEIEQFTNREGYYGTALHELVHWSGHSSRLDRPLIARFGTEGYAFEELIAETGAALLCAATEITPEPRADHAKYLNNWLAVLRDDKKAIFTAFSKAQAAADYVLGAKLAELEPTPDRPEREPIVNQSYVARVG